MCTIEDSISFDELNRPNRSKIQIRNVKHETQRIVSHLTTLINNINSSNDVKEKDKLFEDYMHRNTYKFISLRRSIDKFNIEDDCKEYLSEFKCKLSSILEELYNIVSEDKVRYLESTLKQFKFI